MNRSYIINRHTELPVTSCHTVPISNNRPWDMDWSRVTDLMIMVKQYWRSNRVKRPKVYRKIFAKDKARRIAKHRRDCRAAAMNPAWQGQPWVKARFVSI